ncbi:MAG: hypothetical protein HY236_17610 [Acidobacteria bacterium]|nr:hypothetical protein [Acidobacteriota bacterium]
MRRLTTLVLGLTLALGLSGLGLAAQEKAAQKAASTAAAPKTEEKKAAASTTAQKKHKRHKKQVKNANAALPSTSKAPATPAPAK